MRHCQVRTCAQRRTIVPVGSLISLALALCCALYANVVWRERSNAATLLSFNACPVELLTTPDLPKGH